MGDLPPRLALAPACGMRMVNLFAIPMPGAHHRSRRIRTEVPNLIFLPIKWAYSPELILFVLTMQTAACSGYLAASQAFNVAALHAVSDLQWTCEILSHLLCCGCEDRCGGGNATVRRSHMSVSQPTTSPPRPEWSPRVLAATLALGRHANIPRLH
uniref:U1764t n=1 Tax=Mycobacterium leprae TaxID=1769 RepID=Q50003_MYCLR|nr:u1764t [Mycobacterium leprae]